MSFGGSTAFVHPAIPITLPADLWNYAMILLGVPADRLWVNPDCGLKTRKWEEVRPALANLVAAAKAARGVSLGWGCLDLKAAKALSCSSSLPMPPEPLFL